MTTVAVPRRRKSKGEPASEPPKAERRVETVPGLTSDDREAGLATKAKSLGSRGGARNFERWLLTIGALLLPLGLVLVVLGWQGASHTPLVFEQIPYLLSGGVLGLALVFVGGFVYFAYWQSVMIRDSRTQQSELTQALGRIESLLASGARVTDSLGGSTNGLSQGSSINADRGFVATQSGSMLHRGDCAVVIGRDNLRIIAVDSAEASALLPCRICEPLATS